MAFIPRAYDDVTAGMVNWLAANPDSADGMTPTDLVIGSNERSHLESVAVQIEGLETRVLASIQEAVRNSCYRAFGFNLLPEQTATGAVVATTLVTQASPIPISTGTNVLSNTGIIFQTTAPGVILAGSASSVPIPVVALTGGVAGNVPSGSLTRLALSIPGVDIITNPLATLNGLPAETESGRAARFSKFITTLVRGTLSAIEFGAISSGYAVVARAIEPFLLDPIPVGVPFAGLVWLFVDEGLGQTTLSPTGLAAIKREVSGYVDVLGKNVPGWKAAGVVVSYYQCPLVPVKVRASVRLKPSGAARQADVKANLLAMCQDFFSRIRIAEILQYQPLATALFQADPDIEDLTLWVWRGDLPTPPHASIPLAQDVDPVNLTLPLSVGSRCILSVASETFEGAARLYPEWIIE